MCVSIETSSARRRRTALSIVTVLGGVVLTTLLRLTLNPLLGPKAAVIVYCPVLILSAWVGGWAWGLTALALSALAATYFFLSPGHTLIFASHGDLLTLLIFVVVGVCICGLSSAQSGAHGQAAQNAAVLREREAFLRASEGSLRASEARKSAVLEVALDCIITADRQGCIVEFNPAAERTFGWERAEVLGLPIAEVIVPPALRDAHRQGLAHYLATGEGPILRRRIEVVGMHRDGSEFPVEIAIVPTEGADVEFTAYLRDITDRKREQGEREALLAAVQAQAQREALLNRINAAIRATTDPEAIQEVVASLVGEALGVDRCYFSAYDNEGGVVRITRDWRRPGLPSVAGEYPLSSYGGYIETLYAHGTAAIADSQDPAVPPEVGRVLTGFGIRAFLAVPLIKEGRFMAAIAATVSGAPRAWTSDEIALMEAALTQTRLAAEAARVQQREHRIATDLQNALQPPLPAFVPGLAVASFTRPALEEALIGGDFFDCFPLDKEQYALVVGDVSGKGLAAAQQLALVRNSLRTVLYLYRAPARAALALNAIVTTHDLLVGFVTAFVGVYDASTGEVTYCSCGHEPALVRRASQAEEDGREEASVVEELESSGPPLGVAEFAEYSESRTTLGAGDTLLLYTDGISESGPSRRDLLGTDGLARLFGAAPGRAGAGEPDMQAEAMHLVAAAGERAQGLFRDDVCLLIARRT